MTPREYGEHLASLEDPIAEDVVDKAALILNQTEQAAA